MSNITELERIILNAQGGGQQMPFALEPCSTDTSIFEEKIQIKPLYIEFEAERKRQQDEEEQRKRNEEERLRQLEEERIRQLELKERRRVNGVAEPIDLGVSVLWAAHNLGAFSADQPGTYATWDNLDTAMQLWGEDWHVPSLQEIQELMNQCLWSWSNLNGMPGFLVTGVNGNTIFFPACGAYMVSQYDAYGIMGRYWTSQSDPRDEKRAMFLEFSQYSGNTFSITKKIMLTIRPVKNK